MYTERLYTPAMSESNGKAVGAETIKQSALISPDPREHVKMAQHYIELGFDHLIFHCAGPDQRVFIESYGQEVLPQLRSTAARMQSGGRPVGGARERQGARQQASARRHASARKHAH